MDDSQKLMLGSLASLRKWGDTSVGRMDLLNLGVSEVWGSKLMKGATANGSFDILLPAGDLMDRRMLGAFRGD